MEGEADGEMEDAVFRRAFESVRMPAMLLDGSFRVRAMNDTAVSFTGYDRESLAGREATALIADESTALRIGEQLMAGYAWNGDVRVRTADGRIVHGQGSAAPLAPTVGTDGGRSDAAPAANETQSAAGTRPTDVRDATEGNTTDVSESETTNAADVTTPSADASAGRTDPQYVVAFVDARQKRQYENAAEVLDRLLRHDLRNGLNLVYGYVQQARSQTNDRVVRERLADARETLSEILDKSERARDLRSLLDRAYEESTHPVRLDQVLADTVEKLDEAYPSATVETTGLPAVRVSADDLLSAAVEGVVENGIVHDDNDPHVRVWIERREATAVVHVADEGPGVPAGRADEVFGRGQTDALNHGDGLSLFFADSVVRSYDGRIWFEDATEGGTVFKIELSRVGLLGDREAEDVDGDDADAADGNDADAADDTTDRPDAADAAETDDAVDAAETDDAVGRSDTADETETTGATARTDTADETETSETTDADGE